MRALEIQVAPVDKQKERWILPQHLLEKKSLLDSVGCQIVVMWLNRKPDHLDTVDAVEHLKHIIEELLQEGLKSTFLEMQEKLEDRVVVVVVVAAAAAAAACIAHNLEKVLDQVEAAVLGCPVLEKNRKPSHVEESRIVQ